MTEPPRGREARTRAYTQVLKYLLVRSLTRAPSAYEYVLYRDLPRPA